MKKSYETDVSFIHGQNESKLETTFGFKNKQQKINCVIFCAYILYFARKQIVFVNGNVYYC